MIGMLGLPVMDRPPAPQFETIRRISLGDTRMSWEEMSSTKSKCPCGQGTYTVRSYMDDWNRLEDRWEMDCPECQERFQLYTYYYLDSGMTWDSKIWVLSEEFERYRLIEEELEIIKVEVVGLFISRYLDRWISYFDDTKTKKDVWRRLTDNGERYPSLSTFYSHIRGSDVLEYLRKEVNFHNLPFMITKLGIVDILIVEKLAQIENLENEVRISDRQLIKTGFR